MPDLEEAPSVGGEEHGEAGGRPGRSRQPGRGRVHRQDRVHAEILVPHLSHRHKFYVMYLSQND